jgi:hypothetical protein
LVELVDQKMFHWLNWFDWLKRRRWGTLFTAPTSNRAGRSLREMPARAPPERNAHLPTAEATAPGVIEDISSSDFTISDGPWGRLKKGRSCFYASLQEFAALALSGNA